MKIRLKGRKLWKNSELLNNFEFFELSDNLENWKLLDNSELLNNLEYLKLLDNLEYSESARRQ